MEELLRSDKLPHIWCPGCGHGTILSAALRAIEKSNLDPKNTVVVSGIGCSSRAPGYMNLYTLHTTHGRAIPFATGVKLAKPHLNVIVMTGDGDCLAIGGNHFIHAARRNINLSVIVFNNSVYGMTSGQHSPSSPKNSKSSSTPYGNLDRSFNVVELAQGAGATFVARSASVHPFHLEKILVQSFNHNGFSVVDALSQCTTYYGRKNGFKNAPEMLKWQKQNTQFKISTAKMDKGKIPLGVFVDEKSEPEYVDSYQEFIKSLGGDKK